METVNIKEIVLKTAEDLPSGASLDEAMERMLVLYKIEKGIQQANAEQTLSHDEAKQRLQKWLK
jgi:hypothetical protein